MLFNDEKQCEKPAVLQDISGAPLAQLMRPKIWQEIVGQKHLLGAGCPLYLALKNHAPHSMILCGPAGVGKTTLASVMASAFDVDFIALSAVFSGVKDIRAATDKAQVNLANNIRTLLFVDEIHRFNKSQQDALLPYAENGLIIFIGATTENPSFEVNQALLSRLQIYFLKPLSNDELKELLNRAIIKMNSKSAFTEKAADLICDYADGDARKFLNAVEQVLSAASIENVLLIDIDFLEKILTAESNVRRFDKGGDSFYEQISALHKSVRGSDANAALYWLSRMLDGGADARYLSRRIIRMSWEDIGLADPRAMQIANDAAATFERLGSPEGELALAQAVIYLAAAPKSNAGYMAFKAARAFVKSDKSRAVPVHLRNAPTKVMKELGYGAAYRYSHDEQNAFSAGQSYWPDNMPAQNWYKPVPRGLEIKISEKLNFLKSLNEDYLSKNTKS